MDILSYQRSPPPLSRKDKSGGISLCQVVDKPHLTQRVAWGYGEAAVQIANFCWLYIL